MKALLIGNYIQDRQESMQRFTSLMQQGLIREGHHVRVIRPPVVVGRLKRSAHGIGKWLGYLDKFVLFPPLLHTAARWADVVHICDHSNAMYTRYLRTKPHVVTCHDLLAIRSALGEIEQNQTRWSGRWLQRYILRGLQRAQYIACVSEATMHDLHRITTPAGSSSVVYNALSYPYSPMSPDLAWERLANLGVPSDTRFLLHVGGNQWYKNRLGVLQIFSKLIEHNAGRNLRLVMVGKQWTTAMKEFTAAHDIHDLVVQHSDVSNEDLRALYSTATALLFPSFHEGFGWPIIEAQACGCTVFTSNRAPMNQIAGEAATYIDPDDATESARIVAAHLDAVATRRTLNLQNAGRFAESKMIGQYVSIYKSVIQANASSLQAVTVAE